MWASLPMLVLASIYQDPSAILALLSVVFTAYILRTTISWQMALIAAVVTATAGSLIFEYAAADTFARLVEITVQFQSELLATAQDTATTEQVLPLGDASQIHNMWFGFLSAGYAISTVLFLMLARWWQSELYNEGGFGLEFQALRLSPTLSSVLIVAVVASFVLDVSSRWYMLLMVPMLMSAIGFVHWYFREKEISRSWFVSFYLLLIFMSQLMMPILASLAMMDSLLDLRNRIRSDREV